MSGWWVSGWLNEWMGGSMNGWVSGCGGAWMGESVDGGSVDGWVSGWVGEWNTYREAVCNILRNRNPAPTYRLDKKKNTLRHPTNCTEMPFHTL